MTKFLSFNFLFLVFAISISAQKNFTQYVNPFLGTAPLTDSAEIGYKPPNDWRVWAGLTYPGASLPNAMVQLSPVTEFGSGAGYEYEDSVIHAFTHTNKGHWNLCHIPVLPVNGEVNPNDFGSGFSHQHESAHPGYYQVFLERYAIRAELTSSLRCGYHRYAYKDGADKKVVVDLQRSNERVRDWKIEQDGENVFKGYQDTGGKVYFYATTNYPIENIESVKSGRREVSVIHFAEGSKSLEIKIGLSFVSAENARENLEDELAGKSFSDVGNKATEIWEDLLSKIEVSGGTEREKELFYSSLYRSFLWPALRSDVNGEFTDQNGMVVNYGYREKSGFFISHQDLRRGEQLLVTTQE